MDGNSQRWRIEAQIAEQFGTQPEHLWESTPEDTVFRHPASKKWFAVVLGVPGERFGLAEDVRVQVINIKCDPLLRGSLLQQKGFFPAYHMSKAHWVSVLLDSGLEDGEILPLVEMSYDSVAPKPKKRPRALEKQEGL